MGFTQVDYTVGKSKFFNMKKIAWENMEQEKLSSGNRKK
jgi:hypothetical protein